jgi:N utilization substance protein B
MAVVQFLYSYELNPPDVLQDGIRTFFDTRDEPRDYYAFAEELAYGVIEKLEPIDEKSQGFAQNWEFDRIAKVDLSILRLAIYEMIYRLDIPPIVSIDEAIELSKVFSNPDSKRFINGILDKMKGDLTRPLRKAME